MIVDPNAPDFEQATQKRICGSAFEYYVGDWINYNYSNWEKAKEFMAHNGAYLWNEGPMYSSPPKISWKLGLACIEQVLKTAARSRPRGPLDELVAFVGQHNRRDCLYNAIAVSGMMACERHYYTDEDRSKSIQKTFKSTLPLIAYLSAEEKLSVREMVAARPKTEVYLDAWDAHFSHKDKMKLNKAVKNKIKSSVAHTRKM